VVTTDVGGLRDFVEHMNTGVSTYAGDSGSLAWGLLQVLRNPDLADHLRRTAYEKVNHVYNWKVIADRTYEVYSKVVDADNMIKAQNAASQESEEPVAAVAGKKKGVSK